MSGDRDGDAATSGRRSVLGMLAGLSATSLGLMWLVPGARYLTDPLARRAGAASRWKRVAKLADLSAEAPVACAVVGERVDAWTRTPAQRLGTVWLRKKGERGVVALQAECPHLGCSIQHEPAAHRFACPCHESFFDLEGKQTSGPSPRGMDALEARVTAEGDVEVKFARFRTQTRDRVELG
jgi:menaquinol-cytochrome c reductase iron-sulfur subunit